MSVATVQPAHQAAWRSGVMLDEDGSRSLTTHEALIESGLNWTVEKTPAQHSFNGEVRDIPGRWCVRRVDTGQAFGTVGKTWHPTQNADGFKIVDDLMALAGNDRPCWIETAMPIQNGKKVILMVRLDMGLQIAGEDYHTYLSFVNGHDGRTSVIAMTHDSRYVCANGQIGALNVGYRNANAKELAAKHTSVVRVRHTKNAGARIKEAIKILGMRDVQAEELAKQGEWLCEQSLDNGEFDKFLSSLMPIDEETTTGPHKTMIGLRREAIQKIHAGADNLAPIRGTRWGALQAVLEYADHGREFKTTDTAVASQLGLTDQPLKTAALRILADKRLRTLDKITA